MGFVSSWSSSRVELPGLRIIQDSRGRSSLNGTAFAARAAVPSGYFALLQQYSPSHTLLLQVHWVKASGRVTELY
jgi:hypothetical protein